MPTALCAQVAVDKAALTFDRLFTYSVPPSMASVQPGCRVVVPFGRGNARRTGVVMALSDEGAGDDGVKPLLRLVDSEPVLAADQIALVHHIKERCYCTYFDAVNLMLPTALRVSLERVITPLGDAPADALAPDAQALLAHIRTKGAKGVRERVLADLFAFDVPALLRELHADGFIAIEEHSRQRTQDATKLMVALADDAPDNPKLTPLQQRVYDILMDVGNVTLKELLYFAGVSRAVVDGLRKKGLVTCFEQPTLRTPRASSIGARDGGVTLTPMQQRAFDTIARAIDTKDRPASLLFGVTGSGKTEVFLKLIEETLARGQQVIMMVPEIALTPQMAGRFKSAFGDRVALVHSALSLGERLDEWKRMRTGAATVAVGTRSAVFAPFADIGLIIIDEEQESSYRSEKTPRFHTRDIALFRAAQHGAHVVLSSATPSVESYYYAKKGDYHLVPMRERYGDAVLPQVTVADMAAEHLYGGDTIGATLYEALHGNLERGEQSVLLLNRRGYTTVARCHDCHEVVTCKHCSVAMTYHRANDRLVCHYCGAMQDAYAPCPSCGGRTMKYTGAGTQKLEESVRELFPQARVLRMDTDAQFTRAAYERSLYDFEHGYYDIMIGTQIVAKGLDFENVTLAAVVGGDTALFSDDFRANERAFSLMTQVVGRSGRGGKRGTAVIQTFMPFSPTITFAAQQDYEGFWAEEIAARKLLWYPPFCEMTTVLFAAEHEGETHAAAGDFLRVLRDECERSPQDIAVKAYPPVEARVFKVAGRYRYRLTVKHKGARMNALLHAALLRFLNDSSHKHVTISIDRD